MPQQSYYLNSSTVATFFDFRLGYGGLTLAGTSIFFVGSRRADSIFLMSGMSLDFTAAGAGSDTVYLQGNLAEYSISTTSETITFAKGEGATREILKMSAMPGSSADTVVFRDGSALSSAIADAFRSSKTPILNTSQTSANPAPQVIGTTSVTAYTDIGPSIFTSFKGADLLAIGSRGVDRMYVKEGSTANATALGGGIDLVYMRGNWSDYTKSYTGETMTFTRSTPSGNEMIITSAMIGSGDDQLIFFDGSVRSVDARLAYKNNPTIALSAISSYNRNLFTPGVDTSIINPTISSIAGNDADANLITTNKKAFTISGLELANNAGYVSGIDYFEYRLNESANWTAIRDIPSSTYDLVLNSPLNDGLHTIDVRQIDISGNTSAIVNRSFLLDTINVDLLNIGNATNKAALYLAQGITNSRTFTASNLESVNIEMGISGFHHLEYRIDNQTGSWITGSTGEQTITLDANLPDGPHIIYVREIDNAGNASAISSKNFSLDSLAIAPIVALANDSGFSNTDDITNGKSFTVSGLEMANSANGISGFHHLEWQLDGTAGAWIAESIDTANFNLGAISDGSHTLYVRQIDHAGNISNVAKQQFIFDTNVVTPLVTINGINEINNPNHFGRSFSFSFNGMEEIDNTHGASGFHHFEYSIDNSNSWVSAGTGKTSLMLTEHMSDGLHNINFRQVDNAGNYSQATSIAFVLDTSVLAPSLKFSSDGTSGANFSATGLETQDKLNSGFKNLVYQVDDSPWVNEIDGATSFTIKNLATGNHKINLYELDWLGNASPTITLNFSHKPYWSTSSGWGDANVLGAMNILGQTNYTSRTAPIATATQLKSMDFQSAWNLGYTGKGIVIADIDTGIDLTNGAFMSNINRYMNGAYDWNFLNSTTDVQDDNGHGTLTAMELVSKSMTYTDTAGNSYYAQGGAYDAELMTLKVLDAWGRGYNNNIASAITWAVDHGANVINLSLGSLSPSPELYTAVKYASDHDVITCMAAGNSSGTTPLYPAHYADSLACAISVGASQASIDGGFTLANFSNQAGSSTPYNFVTALGVNIFGIKCDGVAGFHSGTSMATPLIAAEVAVLLSMQSNATAEQIVEAVTLSANPLSVI